MNKGTDANSSKTETPLQERLAKVVGAKLIEGRWEEGHLEALEEVVNQEVRQVLEGLKAQIPISAHIPAKFASEGYIEADLTNSYNQAVEDTHEAIDSLLERYK